MPFGVAWCSYLHISLPYILLFFLSTILWGRLERYYHSHIYMRNGSPGDLAKTNWFFQPEPELRATHVRNHQGKYPMELNICFKPLCREWYSNCFLEITETKFLGRSSNLEFPGRRATRKGESDHKTFMADFFHWNSLPKSFNVERKTERLILGYFKINQQFS